MVISSITVISVVVEVVVVVEGGVTNIGVVVFGIVGVVIVFGVVVVVTVANVVVAVVRHGLKAVEKKNKIQEKRKK